MERVDQLVAHATAGMALELRTARLIAWFKRRNLLPLGYASYRVFAAEHVDWADSWMRACVRLVESPLEGVKAAVCHGILPLRVAVRAPGKTDAEGEAGWIARALADRSVPRRRPPEPEVDLSGEELHTIHAARELARIHLGFAADDVTADRYILAQWRRRDPAATLRDAMTAPPPPAPLPARAGQRLHR